MVLIFEVGADSILVCAHCGYVLNVDLGYASYSIHGYQPPATRVVTSSICQLAQPAIPTLLRCTCATHLNYQFSINFRQNNEL
jgi:hypothetical protein